ncbi:UNVERIFIED_CONTAM: hypothetical protein FKN15_013049 [Acipenser sinensis]
MWINVDSDDTDLKEEEDGEQEDEEGDEEEEEDVAGGDDSTDKDVPLIRLLNKNFRVPIWTQVTELPEQKITSNIKKYTEVSDLRFIPRSATRPAEFFELLFSTELQEHICNESNIYALEINNKYRERNANSKMSERLFSWWSVSGGMTQNRLRAVLGLWLNMGLVWKPDMKEYWNTKDALQATPGFVRIMSCDKFLFCLANLLLNNKNQKKKDEPGYDNGEAAHQNGKHQIAQRLVSDSGFFQELEQFPTLCSKRNSGAFWRLFTCHSVAMSCTCGNQNTKCGKGHTVLARCLVFPVIVKGQREAAKLNNHLPEMTKLTNRMNEAKHSGNKFDCEFSKAYSDMMIFQKKHDINPFRGFLVPLVQYRVSVPHFHTLGTDATAFAYARYGRYRVSIRFGTDASDHYGPGLCASPVMSPLPRHSYLLQRQLVVVGGALGSAVLESAAPRSAIPGSLARGLAPLSTVPGHGVPRSP